MKKSVLSALLATTHATTNYALEGADCYNDSSICGSDLTCAFWLDASYGTMATCEDCSSGEAWLRDSQGNNVQVACPRYGDGVVGDDCTFEGQDKCSKDLVCV